MSKSTRRVWAPSNVCQVKGRRLGKIGLFLAAAYLTDENPARPKLLYIWHNRKERSRSIPWGLVAPMQLNLWSRSQREAVHETVRAHCTAYGLHLVALVISPHSKSLHGPSPLFENALDSTERSDVPSGNHADEDTWRTTVLDEVTEPAIMACDYKSLLAEASGRVIILSNFSESRCIVDPSFRPRSNLFENRVSPCIPVPDHSYSCS